MSRARRLPTSARLSGPQRRQQILAAAGPVFGRLGYEATRMSDVAAGAGVATGLLYKHFASKDELFVALVEQQGSEVADELAAVMARGGPGVDTLRSALEVWLDRLETPEFQVADPGIHRAYEALHDRFRDLVADGVAPLLPELDPDALRIVAAVVEGAAEAGGEQWRSAPRSLGREEALDLLATFIDAGLRAIGDNASSDG